MGYDPFSPIAPAFVNVLCIPAGRIEPVAYQQHVEWLTQRMKCVRVIQDQSHPQSSTQNPSSPEDSKVLLFNVSSSTGRQIFEGTNNFESNRNSQLVFGILDYQNTSKEDRDHDSTYFLDALDGLTSNIQHTYGSETTSCLLVFNAHQDAVHGNVVYIYQTPDQLSRKLQSWLIRSTATRLEFSLDQIRSTDVKLPTVHVAIERPVSQDGARDARSDDGRRQSVMSTLTRTTSPPTQSSPVPEEADQASASARTVAAALIKLQLGNWAEALEQLADGARAARDGNNPAWHAKALEGILACLLLNAWAGRDFQIPQNCYPTTRGLSSSSSVHAISEANRSISEKFAGSSTHRMQALTAFIPGLVATILNLYDRAVFGWDNSLPRILVCEARVRLAALLSIIAQSNGLVGRRALETLFGTVDPVSTTNAIEDATVSLSLNRSLIASLLGEAITEAQANLHIVAAAPIYIAVCQELEKLDLLRKQGFWLKDVLYRITPLLLDNRRMSRATVAGSSTRNVPRFNLTNPELTTLIRLAMRSYGLPSLEILRDDGTIEEQTKARLSSWLSVFVSGDVGVKLEVLRLCLRLCDALPDFSTSMRLMSMLLLVARQTITISTTVQCTVPLLAAEEQIRLVTAITNIATAPHRQSGVQQPLATFWDDFLVRDVTLQEPVSTGRLMSHTSSDLSMATTSGVSKEDPFIYNPFSSEAKSTGPGILVQGEIASFDVVLQNPLEVDIEIESIVLVTDGCAFEPANHSVVVGPLSVQVFTLQGMAAAEGDLKIVGCKVKIKHCHERQFSIYRGQWKPSSITKRSTMDQVPVTLPAAKTLDLKVVEAIPQLQVISSSLIQPSVMMLDGESSRFSITLANPGSIPADLVLFTYKDSASTQIQGALSKKDLQPIDMYELHYQLAHRPAIRRIRDEGGSKSSISIDAKSKETFHFEVTGRPGLTEVVVLVDYAYLGKPRSEIEGTFFTRQLKYPISVSVNGSVDIQRCAVLSLPKNRERSSSHDDTGSQSLSDSDTSQCLLQLDLRSFWQSPLTVNIETATQTTDKDEKVWAAATTTTLLPAQTTRTLVPVPRIYIANPFEPIPSLLQNNRQFIVNSKNASHELEMATRESFWYRERITNNIRMTWTEVHGGRHGQVDVRKGIRLSPRMIDAIRVEHVQIHFEMSTNGTFTVPRNEFAKLIIKIHNATQEDLALMLRLQPSLHDQPHNIAMDLSKKFLWNGVLQKVIRPVLKPGETATSELEIIGLVAGVYEVNATVEDVKAKSHGGSSERRIWHASSPALIHIV